MRFTKLIYYFLAVVRVILLIFIVNEKIEVSMGSQISWLIFSLKINKDE